LVITVLREDDEIGVHAGECLVASLPCGTLQAEIAVRTDVNGLQLERNP